MTTATICTALWMECASATRECGLQSRLYSSHAVTMQLHAGTATRHGGAGALTGLSAPGARPAATGPSPLTAPTQLYCRLGPLSRQAQDGLRQLCGRGGPASRGAHYRAAAGAERCGERDLDPAGGGAARGPAAHAAGQQGGVPAGGVLPGHVGHQHFLMARSGRSFLCAPQRSAQARPGHMAAGRAGAAGAPPHPAPPCPAPPSSPPMLLGATAAHTCSAPVTFRARCRRGR